MSNKNRKTPAEGRTYEVGYGRLPRHGQFRPGRSGNPHGRPEGVRNLATEVRRILQIPVKVRVAGRSRKVSTQAGMLMLLREKALRGETRALKEFVELAIRFNNEPGAEGARVLSADDKAILAAYLAENPAPTAPTTSEAPPQLRVRRRRRSQ
jgi:hypothetical protein